MGGTNDELYNEKHGDLTSVRNYDFIAKTELNVLAVSLIASQDAEKR